MYLDEIYELVNEIIEDNYIPYMLITPYHIQHIVSHEFPHILVMGVDTDETVCVTSEPSNYNALGIVFH